MRGFGIPHRSLRSLLALVSRRQLLTRCSGAGFTSLRRELGWFPPHQAGAPHPEEERLSRAIAAGLLQLDDTDRLRATAASLAASAPPDPEALSEREMCQWHMLTAQLFGTGRQWRPLDQALDVLWQAGAWREELIQLLRLLAERANRRLHPLPWALPVPLRVHGHYTRAEIEAAFGVLTDDAPWIHREVVLWHQASATDLLFITLRKSEALFSPSTRYRDLALGPALFHWESQSTASSPTGQRYIHHASRGSRVLLFVREQRKRDGRPGAPTEPFVCLGFATYETHEGERQSGDSLAAASADPAIPAAFFGVGGGGVSGDSVNGKSPSG